MIPDSYRELETGSLTRKSSMCGNCKNCYVPPDFLLRLNNAEFFCNLSQDRPISGDVLSEPFDYYNDDTLSQQIVDWNVWSAQHAVKCNGVCEKFASLEDNNESKV